MRDNHDGMPEILDAYERDGHFFGVVQVGILGRLNAFEFGVDRAGYRALRRVLQERPFEKPNSGRYRYFYAQCGKVRIESDRDGRKFSFHMPPGLQENLQWFFELEDLRTAAHLKKVPPRCTETSDDQSGLRRGWEPDAIRRSQNRMKYNADLVEKRVQQELSQRLEFNNGHGITLENIEEFLVRPFEVPVYLNYNSMTFSPEWVVLQECKSPTEGYVVVFDPEEFDDCPWGIALHISDGNYLHVVGAETFAEALNGM